MARPENEPGDKLSLHFGEQWLKQIAKDFCARWEERREKAVKVGEQPMPIIHYSDFGDYLQTIEFKQNWRDVFSSIFQR